MDLNLNLAEMEYTLMEIGFFKEIIILKLENDTFGFFSYDKWIELITMQ